MKTTITFIAKINDKSWPHFKWNIDINGEQFEYKTGIGHVKNNKPTIPEIDHVLACLFSDAQCGQSTFPDFCADFGYDTDSRKALETYLACQQSCVKLRKALGSEFDSEQKRIEALEI